MTNENKEFLYTLYDRNLVNCAIEESKELYKEYDAEFLCEMLTTDDMLSDKTGVSEIYDEIQRQMVYSYLQGASYAVSHELTSIAPSEETFSEFHKNVDFAVLFNFSDNDFSSEMEAAAKIYCDEFNKLLSKIDRYSEPDLMDSRDKYIKEFDEICKIDNIKEIMKCGFLAERIKRCVNIRCGEMPNADATLENVECDMNYIPWNEDRSRWEKIDGKYVETEKFPRFITGTYEEIAEAVKRYGDASVNQERDFPVWCNDEVIILYMKNGRLTYLTR